MRLRATRLRAISNGILGSTPPPPPTFIVSVNASNCIVVSSIPAGSAAVSVNGSNCIVVGSIT